MKVCKKLRLLTKDAKGFYVKNDNAQVLRNRAVIEEKVVTESENSYKETGILWVVDEEATEEWEQSKNPKKEVKKEDVKTLEFGGLVITEDNIDDFIKDNDISLGRAKSVEAKLKKVEEFINKQ